MPAEAHLAHNFRSVHGIAEFARAVLTWRKRLLGGQDPEMSVLSAGAGEAPLHLCADPATISGHLVHLGGDAAILVSDEESRARLRQELQSPST